MVDMAIGNVNCNGQSLYSSNRCKLNSKLMTSNVSKLPNKRLEVTHSAPMPLTVLPEVYLNESAKEEVRGGVNREAMITNAPDILAILCVCGRNSHATDKIPHASTNAVTIGYVIALKI